MFRIEHNVETGKIEKIDLTPQEIEKAELMAVEEAALTAIQAAELKAKRDARKVLLEKLGITEDEAKLLLS